MPRLPRLAGDCLQTANCRGAGTPLLKCRAFTFPAGSSSLIGEKAKSVIFAFSSTIFKNLKLFCLGHVRLCTLQSANPRLPRLAGDCLQTANCRGAFRRPLPSPWGEGGGGADGRGELSFPLSRGAKRRGGANLRKRGAGPLSCHPEEQSDEGSQTESRRVGSDSANVGRKRKAPRQNVNGQTPNACAKRQGRKSTGERRRDPQRRDPRRRGGRGIGKGHRKTAIVAKYFSENKT